MRSLFRLNGGQIRRCKNAACHRRNVDAELKRIRRLTKVDLTPEVTPLLALSEALRVYVEGLDRKLQVINWTGRRGEVPDVVHLLVQKKKFGDILLDEAEILIPTQVRDVVDASGDKIIDPDHPVAFGQQVICQVRAEKSGSAGDDGNGLRGFVGFRLRG